MKLYLVRHGQTDANHRKIFQGWLNWSLNDYGQNEAAWLRDQLHGLPISKIYTSPLKRAVETTEIIAQGLADPIENVQVEALKEMNFGTWDGLSSEEIMKKDPEVFQNWLDHWQTVKTPEGESAVQLYKRVTCWLDRLIDLTEDDRNLLIVSHEGVILQIIASLLGMGLDECWRFRVKPGSLSVVQIHDGYASLIRLNHHLGDV